MQFSILPSVHPFFLEGVVDFCKECNLCNLSLSLSLSLSPSPLSLSIKKFFKISLFPSQHQNSVNFVSNDVNARWKNIIDKYYIYYLKQFAGLLHILLHSPLTRTITQDPTPHFILPSGRSVLYRVAILLCAISLLTQLLIVLLCWDE